MLYKGGIMNEANLDLRATLERVRWEVIALLDKTPHLELDNLYARVRETLGGDTDMLVASVISALLRAHKIALEPLSAADPEGAMAVALV